MKFVFPAFKVSTMRQPFKDRANRVLELVHSDRCGPMETASVRGSRYFLTFIDEAKKSHLMRSSRKSVPIFRTYVFLEAKSWYEEGKNSVESGCIRSRTIQMGPPYRSVACSGTKGYSQIKNQIRKKFYSLGWLENSSFWRITRTRTSALP